MAQLVNANGSARGNRIVLNSVTVADQEDVRVVGLDGGGFVAVWESTTAPDAQGIWTRQLRAQAFDANGQRRGAEQVVEANDAALQVGDVVALAGGGYAVGWHGRSWIDAQARAYGADLQPLGGALVLHDGGGFQSQVDLVALADGRFAATWAAASDGYNGGDGSGPGVQTRVFATRAVNSTGTTGADTLNGTPLDDRLDGGAGNDLLLAGGGNDTVAGGSGTDTLVLDASTADVLAHAAVLRFAPGVLSRVGCSAGVVDVAGVERLRVSDGLYAVDTLAPTATSPAGEVWEAAALYRALYDVMPGQAELSRWTFEADRQPGMGTLAQAMLAHYAPQGMATTTLVAHLYQVLTGSAAPTEVVSVVASQVGPGKLWETQGDLLAEAARLSLNTDAMVDLAGQPFAGSIQVLDASWWFG
ncbi:MAG: hypothetical protein HY855_13805 [Burkholderiales bacterium]|nr:hypothetical protein [Burkholderiales bacterium]